MPMYDFECPDCGAQFERLFRAGDHDSLCHDCCVEATRVWVSKPPAAIGDACDFFQENGLKTPVRIQSWSEYRRLMKENGNEQMVRHVGVPGSDKSPHTTRWGGADPQTLANAEALVARVTGPRDLRSDEQIEEELDRAVESGEVRVPIAAGDGRTIGITIGNVYSGVLDHSILKRG